jgi:hypothetical protein
VLIVLAILAMALSRRIHDLPVGATTEGSVGMAARRLAEAADSSGGEQRIGGDGAAEQHQHAEEPPVP